MICAREKESALLDEIEELLRELGVCEGESFWVNIGRHFRR